MRKLIKDSEGNVMEMHSVNGFVPPDHEEVSAEELESAEATVAAAKLSASRDSKLNQVRAARAPKLARVDILANLAYLNSWTAGEKTELKNYRQALLDITEEYKDTPASLDDLNVAEIEWPTEPSES